MLKAGAIKKNDFIETLRPRLNYPNLPKPTCRVPINPVQGFAIRTCQQAGLSSLR